VYKARSRFLEQKKYDNQPYNYMKPINNRDIFKAYRNFLLLFALLLVFSIIGVYFFFLTSSQEIVLLNKRVIESERLVTIRSDINNDFEQIMQRMQQLSDFSNMSSAELNNQTLLLNDIQEANQRIQNKLQQNEFSLKSFQLYQKLSNNINTAATIKDSLFTTRFMIESARQQLDMCNKTNQSAITKIKRGFTR
jgi:hypothetical protein